MLPEGPLKVLKNCLSCLCTLLLWSSSVTKAICTSFCAWAITARMRKVFLKNVLPCWTNNSHLVNSVWHVSAPFPIIMSYCGKFMSQKSLPVCRVLWAQQAWEVTHYLWASLLEGAELWHYSDLMWEHPYSCHCLFSSHPCSMWGMYDFVTLNNVKWNSEVFSAHPSEVCSLPSRLIKRGEGRKEESEGGSGGSTLWTCRGAWWRAGNDGQGKQCNGNDRGRKGTRTAKQL